MSGGPWRILQLSTQSATALRFVAPLGRWLRARGHTVVLGCSGRAFEDAPRYVEALRGQGFEVVEIDYPRGWSPWGDARALVQTAALIQRGGFDLVHTHNSKAGILGRAAARWARRPAIVHTNHGLAAAKAGRFSARQEQVHLALERAAAGWSDAIIAVSAAERDKALRYGIAPPERLAVVGQGIDAGFWDRAAVPEAAAVAWRAAQGAAGEVVLGLGRLVPEKGWATFLEAAARVLARRPGVTFVVLGAGPEREALEALGRRLGLGARVVWRGEEPSREGVRLALASASALLFPTRWESFGVAALEAMSMQTAVVTSRLPPLDGLVEDGVTGLLAPVGDAAAFASAVCGLLEAPARRAWLGAAARRVVVAHHSEAARFAEIEAIYRAVTRPGRR